MFRNGLWKKSFPAVVVLLLGCASSAAAQLDPAKLWQALSAPTFRPEKVATVEKVQIKRGTATLLLNGMVAFGEVSLSGGAEAANGRVVAAALRGTGHFHLEPTLALERQQLTLLTGHPLLDDDFTEAIFVFTDRTADELRGQIHWKPGDPGELLTLYEQRRNRWTHYGLSWESRVLKGLLAAKPEDSALFVAELNTRSHGWVTFLVDATDPEQVELQQLNAKMETVDVWTKFPANGRTPQQAYADPLARLEYVVRGYSLEVTVEESTEVKAQAEVSLEMRRSGERVLLFALDPNLRITQVTNEAGVSLAHFQPENPKDRFFLGNYVAVVSPEPFPAGATKLRFRYAGKRIVKRIASGSFFCQSYGWYPTQEGGRGGISLSADQFAGRADFDLRLRVPAKYQAVATGMKTEEQEDGGFRMTHWRSDIPMAVAGFAFGDFKAMSTKVGHTQVEIFANKEPDFNVPELSMFGGTGRFADPSRFGALALAIRSLSPAELTKEMSAEVGNSLQVMEKWFGPYPYGKLSVTNIPYSYGQGWPSLLYLSSLSFLNSFQRQELGINDAVWVTDFFRAHETSHQWWGHAVGWKSYHDQWLSEGFAEFSGLLYVLYRRGPDEYLRLLRQERKHLLESDTEHTVYEQIGPIYAGLRLSTSKHPRGYPVIVYRKGGWVLHMIRMMLYDPQNPQGPDTRFIEMMRDFTQTFHNRSASTDDFKAIVEKHMLPHMDLEGNHKMDWFFDSWVYGTGVPQFEFEYKITPAGEPGKFRLNGSLRMSGVPEGFRTVVPLFFYQGKKYMRAGWLRARGPETTFDTVLGFKPDKVTINEGEDILVAGVKYK